MSQGYQTGQERRGDENSSYVGKVRQSLWLNPDLQGMMSSAQAALKKKDQMS